ncbi:MAG TPA: hypothetical protein VHA11_11975 [Bryobacteraceae bacterium]|nr:hypothetical protein [Bryobacteraceae bacterium]
MKRLAILAFLSVLPLAAGRVDVTSEPVAWVHSGASILIDVAVWNYGVSNPGVSPYPTGINFALLTQPPEAGPSRVADSSATYYEDYLFSGSIESLDGKVSVPLTDAVAQLLGLGTGTMVLSPGTFSSGSAGETGVGVISGSVNLDPATAAALFGSELGARIVLHNLGQGVYIGIGDGYTVRNAASLPGLTGEGPGSVSGITGTVTVANPEPGTWIMGAGALLALAFSSLRSSAARARKRGRSRV